MDCRHLVFHAAEMTDSQLKKGCLEPKSKEMIRNTDLGIIEGLEEYGSVQGGIVFREDLRASGGSWREVYNEWVWERSPHLPALGPLHCHHTSSVLLLTAFASSFWAHLRHYVLQ